MFSSLLLCSLTAGGLVVITGSRCGAGWGVRVGDFTEVTVSWRPREILVLHTWPTDPGAASAALQRLRAARRFALGSFVLTLCGVPAVLMLAPASVRGLALVLLPLGALTAVIGFLRFARLRCPRCGERFFTSERWPAVPSQVRLSWGGHCWHCDLSVGADREFTWPAAGSREATS